MSHAQWGCIATVVAVHRQSLASKGLLKLCIKCVCVSTREHTLYVTDRKRSKLNWDMTASSSSLHSSKLLFLFVFIPENRFTAQESHTFCFITTPRLTTPWLDTICFFISTHLSRYFSSLCFSFSPPPLFLLLSLSKCSKQSKYFTTVWAHAVGV